MCREYTKPTGYRVTMREENTFGIHGGYAPLRMLPRLKGKFQLESPLQKLFGNSKCTAPSPKNHEERGGKEAPLAIAASDYAFGFGGVTRLHWLLLSLYAERFPKPFIIRF